MSGRTWQRAFAVSSACAVLALAWAALSWRHGTQQGASAARPLIILRRGNGAEPESLDIHSARSEAALTVLRDLYEGLTAMGPDGAPIPAAAEGWDISPDGLVYRFHIRGGARWSNGDAVVAEDFVAGWRRLVDPHTGAQYADMLKEVQGATAITTDGASPTTLGAHAEGADVLVVDLIKPTPYFLGLLSHPATFPIHRASLAARGRSFAKPGVMVSNGAFLLTRWDFGSHLVATRNRYYWNDAATRIDGVEYYSFADSAGELSAFRTGQIDVTSSIPAAQHRWVREHLGTELHVAPQLAVYYLGLNLREAPLRASRELRQALSMVIDREQLVRTVTGAGEAPAYTFVPPQVRDYTPPLPDYAGWPMPKRISKARELLRAAGLAGHAPTLELRYNSNELHSRIAVAVAAMWKAALGIDTTLRAEEFKVLLQDIDRGDTSVFRASWLADYDDAYAFLQILQSGFGLNLPHYASPEFDQLLNQAATQGDAARRRELLQDAEARMLVDQPLIPLFFYVSKHLVDQHILGWQDNGLNVVYSKNLAKAAAAAGQ